MPSSFTGQRTLLNFGAVDYEATVFVNGQNVTYHVGGYFEFTVDITSHLNTNGTNELLVFVHDPTDLDPYVIPIGKQTLMPSHIFYTPCSGIWQQVWIESAPANWITQLDVSAGMNGDVNVTAYTYGNATSPLDVSVSMYERNSTTVCASGKGQSGASLTFNLNSPKLWSPNSPTLYDLEVKVGSETIRSYTGFRTISRGEVNGIERPLLNGEFIFQFGTLDQGFWPDGIYVPPNREAMVFDLQTLKNLGFNMLRKHVSVAAQSTLACSY